MKKIENILALAFFGFLTACGGSDGDVASPEVPDYPENPKKAIQLSSRTVNGNFQNGDKIGVFVVNWKGGVAQNLQSSGNYVNNMCFTTQNAVWTPDAPIYWEGEQTVADFYGYSPYGKVTDAKAFPIAVMQQQTDEKSYEQSDFLWGKRVGEKASESVVNLTLDHMMSKAVIKVAAGDGFTDEEIDKANISVSLCNLKSSGTIDLSNGQITPQGATTALNALKMNNHTFQALVLPQQVERTDLVQINYNDNQFKLNRAMIFESQKEYTFTITLTKNRGGINVNVGSWDVVDTDFGGTVN